MSALVIALVIALLTLADRRHSSRSWEEHKRELQTRGINLDWRSYRPTPVPDAENFAKGGLVFPQDPACGTFIGDWTQGKPNDLAGYEKRSGPSAGGQEPGSSTLAALASFNSAFDQLHAASKRPFAAFDSLGNSPFEIRTPSFVAVRSTCQTLSLRVSAFLAVGKPDAAFEDIGVIFKFSDAFQAEKTLRATMTRVVLIGSLGLQSFWEGWVDHKWSAAQLAEFQRRFEEIDLVSHAYQSVNGRERAAHHWLVESAAPADILKNLPPRSFIVSVGGGAARKSALSLLLDEVSEKTSDLIYEKRLRSKSKNYWRRSMINFDRLLDMQLAALDPDRQRYFPERAQRAEEALVAFEQKEGRANLLFYRATPSVLRAGQKVAFVQTMINQAAVICALERFKTEHGKLPATLDELAPKYLTRIPHDLITGDPLRYHLDQDGGFLLYSIGYNRRDEGGLMPSDLLQGDWVWPAGPR